MDGVAKLLATDHKGGEDTGAMALKCIRFASGDFKQETGSTQCLIFDITQEGIFQTSCKIKPSG